MGSMQWCAMLSASVVMVGLGTDTEARRQKPAPSRPIVRIDSPADGATVQSPVAVKAISKGFQLERAGLVRSGAGHLHLVIDAACDVPGRIVDSSPQRLRLDDGSDHADVTLPPGDHTLCLQASDGRHTVLSPRDKITIHVVSTTATGPVTPGPGKPPVAQVVERWSGTTQGPFKMGPDCGDGINTGAFTFEVDADDILTGRGSVSSSQYSCRTPQGQTTIPAATRAYTLRGYKALEYHEFLMMFSNGWYVAWVPFEGTRRLDTDQSVGDYISRSTITIQCVSGC